MKTVVLDTNVLSELFRKDEAVVARLSKVDRILISPIVEGELLAGFRWGSKLEKNLAVWSAFLEEPFVEKLFIGSETAERYSLIWTRLRKNGTPIPSNDIWIAAQACECGHELLSFDGHFEKIEGLLWTLLERSTSDEPRES